MDWAGQSLPFRFRATVGGAPTVVDVASLRCKHVAFGEAPASEQPRFSGE
jgi:hypothetical protein